MLREELIEVLRARYKAGGFVALAPFIEHMQEHGPIHDPEFLTCAKCGREWERGPFQAEDCARCPTCNPPQPRGPVGVPKSVLLFRPCKAHPEGLYAKIIE